MTKNRFIPIVVIILFILIVLLAFSIISHNSSITPNQNDDAIKSRAVDIALENSAVRGLLDGHKYIVNNVMWAGQSENDTKDIVNYPVVEFLVYKDKSNDTDCYVRVAVNLDNNHVTVQSQREFYDYPPPAYPK